MDQGAGTAVEVAVSRDAPMAEIETFEMGAMSLPSQDGREAKIGEHGKGSMVEIDEYLHRPESARGPPETIEILEMHRFLPVGLDQIFRRADEEVIADEVEAIEKRSHEGEASIQKNGRHTGSGVGLAIVIGTDKVAKMAPGEKKTEIVRIGRGEMLHNTALNPKVQ